MKDSLITIAINGLIIAVLATLLLAGSVLFRQWSQFGRGEQALAAGNQIAAIAGYDAALHMYFPGSPLVQRSAERLWQIGELLEKQGDTEKALVAYRSLRSSFYAARWLVTPGREWIEKCDLRLAELAKKKEARDRPSH